ncbi:amidase [Salinirubellus sp. GCM10025818]|uniref:amidase n=1 Tax=Salinirubellus TaxID=2162630 RepID=UPI0030D4C1DD
MRRLSERELIELGAEFGIDVDETEAGSIVERVNEMIEPLDELSEIPVYGNADAGGARTWHEPEDDPLDALAVECDVPPSPDHTGELDGVTVGVKDIVAVAGVPMQCNSAVMNGFTPRTDATVVRRLRGAGARITAKTNLDEFAASASGATGLRGPIRNPHDADHTAGGSSGGSAAAVATGTVDAALGTDTGGSIRIPASFCGVVGLKPTYGLVSLSGVVENTYTQDHVGPITPSVESAARVLEAIAGRDEHDPASLQAAGRKGYDVGGYADAVEDPPSIESLEIGVLEEGFGEGVDPTVEDRTDAVVDRLEDAGATVESVSVRYYEYGPSIKNTLSFTELAAHWRAGAAPYRRGGVVDEGYQSGVAARAARASGQLGEFYRSKLLAGAGIIANHDGRPYTRAQAAREVLREEFEEALSGVDALLMPTMPGTAPSLDDAPDPGFDYGRNTRAADITRLPAVTVPNGADDGLPIGLQLIGDAFGEARLLAAAERVTDLTD